MGGIEYCKDCKFWNGDWVDNVRRFCTHPLMNGDYISGMFHWCYLFNSRPSKYDELFPQKPDKEKYVNR